MKRKARWTAAGVLAVLLLAAWHYTDVQAGTAASGDLWQRGVYAALTAVTLAGLAVLGLLLLRGDAAGRRAGAGKERAGGDRAGGGKERVGNTGRSSWRGWLTGAGPLGLGGRLTAVYPAAGLLLGILYLLVLPPLSAPDEISHYVSAYQLSSKMLGQPSNDRYGRVLLRPQDAWVEDLEGVFEYRPDEDGNLQIAEETLGGAVKLGEVLDESMYQLLWELRGNRQYMPERAASLGDALVSSAYPPVTTTPLAYVPQAVGLSIGRLLGLSTLPLLYLGRLMNLLFFVGMTSLAMRRMPFGQEVLFGVALLPMTLHLSASFSYDVMIMGCMFCFTAVCLDLAYERERVRLRDVGALMALMAVCGPCKIVYAVMMGLCLLIPVRKFGGWGKWALAAAAVGGAWAASMYLVNSQVIVSYATETESYVAWAEEPGYSLTLLLHQPVRLIRMFYQTILWQLEQYHLTMIGAYLGNLDQVLDVPYGLVMAFTAGLLGLAFQKPGESIRMSGGQRLWVCVVCACCAAAAMGSMLIAWTPLSAKVIGGVQGRYFLPFLPALLLALKNRTVVLTKNPSRGILYLMCCLNGYAVLRLFSVVTLRL